MFQNAALSCLTWSLSLLVDQQLKMLKLICRLLAAAKEGVKFLQLAASIQPEVVVPSFTST
jgi:hypothetical protein